MNFIYMDSQLTLDLVDRLTDFHYDLIVVPEPCIAHDSFQSVPKNQGTETTFLFIMIIIKRNEKIHPFFLFKKYVKCHGQSKLTPLTAFQTVQSHACLPLYLLMLGLECDSTSSLDLCSEVTLSMKLFFITLYTQQPSSIRISAPYLAFACFSPLLLPPDTQSICHTVCF